MSFTGTCAQLTCAAIGDNLHGEEMRVCEPVVNSKNYGPSVLDHLRSVVYKCTVQTFQQCAYGIDVMLWASITVTLITKYC